jgi:Domain of unknown function (DUF4307)
MTDTIGSTPNPPRPRPGSEEPALPARFRLPEPDAAGESATRQARSPITAPRPAATAPRGAAGQGGTARPDSSLTAMTPPDGRYGERRGMSMPRKVGLAATGLVILGGVAGYIGWQQANPTIQGTVTSFNAATSTSVVVTFEVDKPADKSATCTLAAEDVHGSIIGSASVPILSGRAKNVQSYTLQTTSTANTVIVQSCSLTS